MRGVTNDVGEPTRATFTNPSTIKHINNHPRVKKDASPILAEKSG
jgi:hypothetical protein